MKLKKILLLIIVFITLAYSCKAQEIKIEPKQSIDIDHLGRAYIFEKEHLTIHYDEGIKEYQNQFLGPIFSIDLSNPLRILVFYKEANQIVFLDNELTTIGSPIQLDELNLQDVSAVCASSINGFWVYNNQTKRIEFYNENLVKTHSSIELSRFINQPESIISMKMSNNKIYLNIENIGILVFDRFSTYLKTLPIKNSNCFQALENSIIYCNNNEILNYNFDLLETKVILHSENPIRIAKLFNKTLYYNDGNLLQKKVLK